MAKKPAPFNNPFAALKLKKAAAAPSASEAREQAKKPASARPQSPQASDDEGALFRQAVGGVEPVKKGPGLVTGGPPPEDRIRIQTEDDEVMEQLAILVGGSGEFDFAESDEFVEGSISGLDRRIVQKLRRGEYAIQGHLDLHGMIKADARPALERFVLASRRAGKRCVLIVHGRGLHSKDQIPVLKQGVQQWLSRGRVAREVIAFATARPCDGGAGAVYVLLRR